MLSNIFQKQLLAFLPKQRYFREKAQTIESLFCVDSAKYQIETPSATKDLHLLVLEVLFVSPDKANQLRSCYFLPLIESPKGLFTIEDRQFAPATEELVTYTQWLTIQFSREALLQTSKGTLHFLCLKPEDKRLLTQPSTHTALIAGEASNACLRLSDHFLLKFYPRLEEGLNLEVEMLEHLQKQKLDFTPSLAGQILYSREHKTYSLGLLENFLADSISAWEHCLTQGFDLTLLSALGSQLAKLHFALAADAPGFASEAVQEQDIERWLNSYEQLLNEVFTLLHLSTNEGLLCKIQQKGPLEEFHQYCLQQSFSLKLLKQNSIHKIRLHGDFHLGQVLLSPAGLHIIDFEGEPLKSLTERQSKQLVFKDLAGLARSLEYVQASKNLTPTNSKEDPFAEETEPLATNSLMKAQRIFFEAYYLGCRQDGNPSLISESEEINTELINFFKFEKALYELKYEINNRPSWASIPLDYLLLEY